MLCEVTYFTYFLPQITYFLPQVSIYRHKRNGCLFNSGQTLQFSSGLPSCPPVSVDDQSSKAFEGGVIREAPGSPLLHPSSRSTQLTWVPAGSILCQHSTHKRSRPDQRGLHRASSSVNVLIRQKMWECWVFSLGLPQAPELSTAYSCVPSLPSQACTGRTPHIQPPAATTQMEARFPVLSDPQTHLGLLSSPPTPQSGKMLRPPHTLPV